MFKSFVNELVQYETIDVRVRSVEGDEVVLKVRPDEKIVNFKQEIWKAMGVKIQMKIGEAIFDVMTEYIQTTDLSYDAFGALPDEEQVKHLAKSGKFYQKFWDYYMILFDAHIVEDEATLIGLGMTNQDELALVPKVILGKRENLFLQLFIGVIRKKSEISVGVNTLYGQELGLPVVDKDKRYHSHQSQPGLEDQCLYELRLLETILMPTFEKIITGDRLELPETLPRFENIKTLLRMDYYKHSHHCLKDIHDMINNYMVNINIMVNFNDKTPEVAFEAEKRETIYYSVMELLNKFESSVTNTETRAFIYPTLYVGPSRTFTQYNYTVALPSVYLTRIASDTTVEVCHVRNLLCIFSIPGMLFLFQDLIESYKHHTGREDLEIGSLMYNGTEYLPYVLVGSVIHKKLQKHYFYFDHDIPDDARDIDDLINFIDGEAANTSSASGPASVPTPKIKKKRKRGRGSQQANTAPVRAREKSESISVSEDLPSASASGQDQSGPASSSGLGAGAELTSTERKEKINFKLEKSGTDQMKKIWQEFSESSLAQSKIFEVSREYDFDITEEEGGPHDMTLEKADYLDKLTNMIAAKAQAEWENKMKGFEKLQEENEEIQTKIREKEKEFEKHKESVTDMIDNQAKAMTNYIGVISKTEDDKCETVKEMTKLDQEIQDLEEKITKIKVDQRLLSSKCDQCDAQIEKMERKRKKLEKYMETEMNKVRLEGETITREIQELNDSLQTNIKATEDLARLDVNTNKAESSPSDASSGKNETTARMVDFLTKSIQEKESDLECPVCFETAEVPIYMCPEMHLIW